MLNTNDILETIQMITDEHLDVRTVTMGISLLDCADPDGRKACEKIYRKITEKAKDLVKTAEDISATYGMPIVNKRISVTPIAMLLASAPDADPVWYAKTLDAAAKAVGVNFIGGFGALVHKGFSAGDRRRGRAAHPQHPGGAGLYGLRLQQHQRRLHQERHQHGRRQDDGARHQGSRGAHAG